MEEQPNSIPRDGTRPRRIKFLVPKRDAVLMRKLVNVLRSKIASADELRSALSAIVMHREAMTAFEVFGSDLPDEAFVGVFDSRDRDRAAIRSPRIFPSPC